MKQYSVKKQFLFALMMAVVLVFALSALQPAKALAKTTSSDVAEDLQVWVQYSNYESKDYRQLQTFTYDYFTANAEEEAYTFIDSLPCPCVSAATGVYLEDLLSDCGISVNDVEKIRFWATDSGSSPYRTLSYEYLFGDSRYYYPNIAVPVTDAEGQTVSNWYEGSSATKLKFKDFTAASAGMAEVEPMLAVADDWQRQDLEAIEPDWDNQDDSIRYRLLFGMPDISGLSNDVSQVTANAFDSGKWIYRMDVVLSKSAPAITEISLSGTAVSLEKGKSKQLSVTVKPDLASAKAVTWSSDNTAVATVSSSGSVKAVAAGSAVITAANADGSIKSVCTVTVTEALDTSGTIIEETSDLALNKTAATLTVSDTLQLNATASGSAKGAKINWTSSDTKILTVDANGLVKAVGKGSAKITVATANGSYSAACSITVTEKQATVSTEFKDLKGHWAEANIAKLVNIGAVNGNPDGSFKPNDTITRAQFITILVKALVKTGKVALDTSGDFTDASNHWAVTYLSTAVANGIVKVQGDGGVLPDALISREEMSVMLARALSLKTTATGSAVTFTDQTKISDWAKEAVAALVQNGGIQGYEDGSYKPKGQATRAEAATAILRTFNNAGYEF